MNNTQVNSNKLATIHVLAALIQNPLLFSDDHYHFSIDDFPEQFHKILFSAIEHLAKSGMEKISYIDIDQFLKQYTVQYQVFCANKGVEYIQNAIKLYDDKKFKYYYESLKKYSLINNLNANGIDTRDIYDPDIIDPVLSAKMQANFDNLTVNDILLAEETKIILAKETFGTSSDRVENHAGDGLRVLKEKFKETPDMGLPLLSPKLTTILRGQRTGCLFIESAPSGTGKALPNSSKLPTPFGWRTVGDIKVGELLFDAQGKPTRVIDIFPQGKKQVYEVSFKDGRTVRCCDEHLWSYYTDEQKEESIRARKFYTKTLREIINNISLKTDNVWNVLVPQQQAVEYPENKHYLSPYVLGVLLGNGFLIEQKNDEELILSLKDQELADNICRATGWQIKLNKRDNVQISIQISDILKGCPTFINMNNLSKFIPEEYLHDSIANRWELLNGLLDINGSISIKTGQVHYCTSSPDLRDNILELAHSLGFQTSVIKDHHKNTDIHYIIQFMGSPELQTCLFKLSYKHKSILDYYTNNKEQKAICEYAYNAIIDIKDSGYQEEMTCFLVDNTEHLFLTDDFVVTHNSRRGNSEACHLAIPEYYDIQQNKWIKTNLHESVLIISTELEEYECQQMWMAFVAGVSESHIKDGRYAEGEEARVDKAISLIEKSNLRFVSITNYDTDDIINIIKKYKQLYDVNYVFFDYLGETLKITSSATKQTRMQGLRTDQVLLMLSSALKDTAKTLGIYIWTASQLSGDYKNAKELDAAYLRSAKSIADKVDAGMILMPVREADQPIIDSYCAKGFELSPNFVFSVYKVRAGSYQNIKVYVYFDRATCQMTDCFVTDGKGIILPVADTNIEIMLDQTKEEKFSDSSYSASTKTDKNISDFDF